MENGHLWGGHGWGTGVRLCAHTCEFSFPVEESGRFAHEGGDE